MRLFHRVEDPLIPAENNFAERELRPLVIARKISFGSQSDAGARTREIMMTILHTLEKRSHNVEAAFKAALNTSEGGITRDMRSAAIFFQDRQRPETIPGWK
ncbi:MAG: transposase [Kiritimatiellia bacterium]